MRTFCWTVCCCLLGLPLLAAEPATKTYVPAPQPVRTKILIGAHHCPLWEADKPAMWDQVVKHPERTPALGFYAQENPEVSDWETKFAVDHGVGFFVYCWYRDGQGGPVKMRFGSAIHDALFKSRYMNHMKFTIMWENQNRGRAGVSNERDLLENLLPFWINNYFRHASYVKIDNRPLLFIYRPEFLIQDLGGVEQVRAALGKMRAACRAAGFDGLYLLGEYRGLDPKHLQLMKSLGLDYTFAYCWHVKDNPTPQQAIAKQLEMIAKTRALNILPEVVTVSQGWSGWHDEGSIWRIPPAEYKELLRRAKQIVESFPAAELGSKILLLDNWNEWSEGHYIAPHQQYGFGYLDAVREVFADAPPAHRDVLPSQIGMGPYDRAYQQEMAIRGRALVSLGDPTRTQRVLARARAGQPVTVAVIGGSITAGAKATARYLRYGDVMARWWQKKFPRTKIEHVNAGIGATGTNFGALRVQRDLLSKRPDFVVIEYAVNDQNTRAAAETLEGLVRQILSAPQQPAAMLLFTMRRDGSNAQEWHGKIGAHYGLPMVSFRDALWPAVKTGQLAWDDIEADMVHPNDRGHAYCAAFVTAVLDTLLQRLPADAQLPAVKPLPAPMIGNLFQRTLLVEAADLKPVANQGWAYDAKAKAWRSDRPGSTIDFDLPGRVLFTMHHVVKGPRGIARVSVDGQMQRELNGWFPQTWGGYRQTNEIARLSDGKIHRVRFELLDKKDAGSEGHEFCILGLGAAGLP